MAQFAGNAHWAEPSPLFDHRARLTPHSSVKRRVPVASTGEGNYSPGSSRLYRLGDLQAEKAKVSGDERPRFIACAPNFLFFNPTPLNTPVSIEHRNQFGNSRILDTFRSLDIKKMNMKTEQMTQ